MTTKLNNLMTAELVDLQSRAARTDARIDAITKDLEGLTSAVHSLADVVRQGAKTPWNNIIGAVGVAFAILSAVFSIVISNQAETLGRVERQFVSRTVQLDTILQREMRLLDDNTKAHMNQIDARLGQRLQQTMERLRTVEAWQRQNNVGNTSKIAQLEAKVEDMQDEIKSLRSP